LIECDICFAEAAINRLALVFVLLEDQADTLALFGREAELFDRIGSGWGEFLCHSESCGGK
jgi:hypothetical protein